MSNHEVNQSRCGRVCMPVQDQAWLRKTSTAVWRCLTAAVSIGENFSDASCFRNFAASPGHSDLHNAVWRGWLSAPRTTREDDGNPQDAGAD
eukprot:3409045-Rhodomonas_salina.1